MKIELEYPDRYQLCGLEQGHRGWTAYLRIKGDLYLQGRVAPTPQQAVDAAIIALIKYEQMFRHSPLAALDINLDGIDL